LIDGAVIGNNPTLFAYLIANQNLDNPHNNIRMVSLGTGSSIASRINPDDINAITWLNNM